MEICNKLMEVGVVLERNMVKVAVSRSQNSHLNPKTTVSGIISQGVRRRLTYLHSQIDNLFQTAIVWYAQL